LCEFLGASSSTYKTSDCSHIDDSIEADQRDHRDIVANEEDPSFQSLNSSFSCRGHIAATCFRNGESRYAVKSLIHEDSFESQQARARIDLAIEVNYLKALSHPHIVKIRGVFETDDPFHSKFFFLMDRLYGTLDDKIMEWRESKHIEKVDFIQKLLTLFTTHKVNIWNRELMKERLFIAHDIASAFSYMHEKHVIHR
jgi:serine/threonine protein kinase